MFRFTRLILCCLFLSYSLFADQDQFGLNTSSFPCGQSTASKNLFDQLNLKWIRAGIDWHKIESNATREPGIAPIYNFEEVDQIVRYAQSNGINILYVLAYAPTVYSFAQVSHRSLDPTCSVCLDKWTAFVTAMVERYDGDGDLSEMPNLTKPIKHWEIWNEPNLHQFWTVGSILYDDRDWFFNYVLTPGFNAIRAADPQAKICGPGLSSSTADDDPINWFNYVTTNGIVFDVLTHHQYDGDDSAIGRFNALQTFHTNAENHGYGGKEYWITETGWPIADLPKATQSMRDLLGSMLANSSWWNKTFWYSWKDDTTNPEDSYPMVDFTTDIPNDLYYTFKSFTNPPYVTVTSPNGGESWSRGSTQTIRWTSNDITNVKIELLKGTIVDTTITSSTAASSGSKSWTIPTTQAIANDYRIRITDTDINRGLSDSSNTNFSITTGFPDVVITNIWLVPAAPKPGQKVTVWATIKNQGAAATPNGIAVAAAFKIDGAGLGAFFVKDANGNFKALTVGESYSGACATQWTAVAGTHKFWVMADDVNRFPESNDNNNVMEKSFTPSNALPDVVITNISLVPAAPTPGQKVTVYATIKNQGTAATPNGIVVAAAFKVDGIALGAFFVRTNGVDRPLAAGESYTAACETLWTATVGTHTLWVKADDVNRFSESNENNNVKTKSITI